MAGHHFIALVPGDLKTNSELKSLLSKMKRTLDQRDAEARFTPPDLWHITLTFLGSLDAAKITAVTEALTKIKNKARDPLELKIAGVGAFPDIHEARVIWLGVQNSLPLKALKSELDAELAAQGVPSAETEPFHPHLTVARLRNRQSVEDLVRLGGRKSFGEYKIGELVFFESVLQGHMTKYLVTARAPI